MSNYAESDLKSEALAARNLIDRCAAAFADDPDEDFRLDVIFGETNLLEAIDKGLELKRRLDADAEGAKLAEKRMAERRKRLEARAEAVELALKEAFESTGLKSLKRTLATFSRRATPPKVHVTNPDELPLEYLKSEPDMTKIREAAKAGAEIPGVTMSNGGESISIREA